MKLENYKRESVSIPGENTERFLQSLRSEGIYLRVIPFRKVRK